MVRKWSFILVCLFCVGCENQPRPPTPAPVVNVVEERIEHERRLRDADRLRLERQLQAVEQQHATLVGISVGLSLATLVVAVWLGVEIRRRRALTQLLVQSHQDYKGGESCSSPI